MHIFFFHFEQSVQIVQLMIHHSLMGSVFLFLMMHKITVLLTTNGILESVKYNSFDLRQFLPNGLPLEPNSQEPILPHISFTLKSSLKMKLIPPHWEPPPTPLHPPTKKKKEIL